MQEKIGEGSSSSVYKCIKRRTGEMFAAKEMRTDDDEKIQIAEQEFKLMQSLDHPHIVKVFDLVKTEGKVYIVMELIQGTELFEAISNIGGYCEEDAKLLFAQILNALKYLHQQHICHRDIKPSNILVAGPSVKVTDFNISKMLRQRTSMLTMTGTECFKAPEMLGK